MTQQQSHLTVTTPKGITVVEFADRKIIDELSIDEIGQELSKIVNAAPDIKLLVSFENVEHLSSAALGMLITLNKRIKERNGQLRLADISTQIYEVFKITRLNKLFEIHDTAEQAKESF